MIRLISNERGDTALVEAYRTLRSNLQYVCNQQKCKLICITAATSGEGTPVHGGDRQAAPVDADGVAQARVLGDGGRLDRQPGAVLDGLEPDDASELLDDSGEHQ